MDFIMPVSAISKTTNICLKKYLDKCINDSRLRYKPSNENINLKSTKVVLIYGSNKNSLTINIKCGGTTYYDNCIDYFYKKDGFIEGKININWNEALKIINKWNKKNRVI